MTLVVIRNPLRNLERKIISEQRYKNVAHLQSIFSDKKRKRDPYALLIVLWRIHN